MKGNLNSQNIIITKKDHHMTSGILVMALDRRKKCGGVEPVDGTRPLPPPKKQHSPLDNCISNGNTYKR